MLMPVPKYIVLSPVVSHVHIKLWKWGRSHTFWSIFTQEFFWAAGTEAYSKYLLRPSQQVARRSFWQSVPRRSRAWWSMLKVSWLTAISKITEPFWKGKEFGKITLLNYTKISLACSYAALPRQQLGAIHAFQTTVVSRGSQLILNPYQFLCISIWALCAGTSNHD